jgi:hypothetical protein
MSKFIFAYHGGCEQPETQEEMNKIMSDWKNWLSSLGDALVDPGHPAGPSKTVNSNVVDDNGGANPLSGYTLIKADNMGNALAIAKDCPHRTRGTIEVAELIEMDF